MVAAGSVGVAVDEGRRESSPRLRRTAESSESGKRFQPYTETGLSQGSQLIHLGCCNCPSAIALGPSPGRVAGAIHLIRLAAEIFLRRLSPIRHEHPRMQPPPDGDFPITAGKRQNIHRARTILLAASIIFRLLSLRHYSRRWLSEAVRPSEAHAGDSVHTSGT